MISRFITVEVIECKSVPFSLCFLAGFETLQIAWQSLTLRNNLNIIIPQMDNKLTTTFQMPPY